MGVGMDIMDKAVVAIILRIKVSNQSQNKNNTSNNQKLNRSEKLFGKVRGPNNKKVYETECYRCGIKGHWSRTCRTTKHLVDLYQASMKGKDKQI